MTGTSTSTSKRNWSIFKLIIFIILFIPLLVILVAIYPIYYYVTYQIRSYRRYKKLLQFDITNHRPHGLAVIEEIKYKPPLITWRVICNGHRTGLGSYCQQEYSVTHPWPSNEGTWGVSTIASRPDNIFDKPYVRMTVNVTATYDAANLPTELKEKEQELHQQHFECDPFKLCFKRKAETTYRIFIVREGYSAEWIPLKYWISSVFLCSGYISSLDHEVEYTVTKSHIATPVATAPIQSPVGVTSPVQGAIESTHTNYNTNLDLAADTIPHQEQTVITIDESQDLLPPSYQTVVADPEKYKLHQEVAGNHDNAHCNYGNGDISVQLPTYDEYIGDIDHVTLHGSTGQVASQPPALGTKL